MVKILAISECIALPETIPTNLFSNPEVIQHVREDFRHVPASVRFCELDNVKDKTQWIAIAKKVYGNRYECFMVGRAPCISCKAQAAIIFLTVSQILCSMSWTSSPEAFLLSAPGSV